LLISGSPHLEIDPALRVGFVQGDDLHQRTPGVAALDVQGATSQGHTEYQAAGPILVRGIILDDFANGNSLTQFLDTDMAHDALVNGVLGELELTPCNFLANIIDYGHEMTLYLNRSLPTQYSGVSRAVRRRTPGLEPTR
jgi:hypothetical protein